MIRPSIVARVLSVALVFFAALSLAACQERPNNAVVVTPKADAKDNVVDEVPAAGDLGDGEDVELDITTSPSGAPTLPGMSGSREGGSMMGGSFEGGSMEGGSL